MGDDLLKQAIDTIKAGRKKEGAVLLSQYLQTNPNSEMGWLWMTACTEDEVQKRSYLQWVLKINPENARAREALQKLEPPVDEPTLDHILSFSPIQPLPVSTPAKLSESDLIPAVCPTCGGKLEVNPDAETLVCQYCGNEHFIRRNPVSGVTLEAYARCPVCHRNDRAEKVSAILRNQTIQSQGVVSQQRLVRSWGGELSTQNVNVPIQSTQTSNLARRLAPPAAPPQKPGGKQVDSTPIFKALAIVSGIWGLCFMIVLFFSPGLSSFSDVLKFLIFAILPLIVSALFVYLAITQKPSKEKFKQEQDELNLQWQVWQNALARWEKLFYCRRDDNVFIPGGNTSAPVEKMIEYIYKN